MNEIEIDKAKMDALRALSDVNLKISDARNTLQKLEETETEYVVSREKRVVERIKQALNESQNLVEETVDNYEAVKEYAATVRNLAQVVISSTELIVARNEEYATRVTLWEKDCNTQEEALARQRTMIQSANVLLNSEKEGIKRQKRLLADEAKKIVDDRGTLERAIKRLEQGRK